MNSFFDEFGVKPKKYLRMLSERELLYLKDNFQVEINNCESLPGDLLINAVSSLIKVNIAKGFPVRVPDIDYSEFKKKFGLEPEEYFKTLSLEKLLFISKLPYIG